MSEVFWIDNDPNSGLAIVLCPRGDDWLTKDLRGIEKAGVGAVVSLLERDEAQFLGLEKEGLIAAQAGMTFLSYAIPDGCVPKDIVSFRSFVSGIAERIRAGVRIGVHCRGSIGRATVTAACALIHLGWKANDALDAIESARGCPIPDTREQEAWILRYEPRP